MSLGWILLILFAVIVIQSYFYRKFSLRNIRYDRFFNVDAVFEGEQVELVERISNEKWLPLPWLRLESLIPAALKFQNQSNLQIAEGEMYQNHKSLFNMLSYTRITRRHQIQCSKRGWYRLQTATMTSGDLFDNIAKSKQWKLDAELIVYPLPVMIDEVPLPAHHLQGDVFVKRWIFEDPFMSSGVRDYQYGDPIQSIHWKSTARVGQLQVRKLDYTADQKLLVLLNFEMDEKMWSKVTEPDVIERGLRWAAAIVEEAQANGIVFGFGCNGYEKYGQKTQPIRIDPQSGKEQLYTVLEAMAKLEIDLSVSFDTYLQREIERDLTNIDYVIISCFYDEKIEGKIMELEAMGNAVYRVVLERNMEEGVYGS